MSGATRALTRRSWEHLVLTGGYHGRDSPPPAARSTVDGRGDPRDPDVDDTDLTGQVSDGVHPSTPDTSP